MKQWSSEIIIGIDARGLEGRRTGVGRYLSNLLRQWRQEGAELPDAEIGKGRVQGANVRFRLYFKNKIPEDLPDAEHIEAMLLPSRSNALWVHWYLPRALKRDGVDALFSPWYVAPLWGMENIPFVITLHDIVFEAHPEWVPRADRLLLRWVARHAARRAEKIITISEFSKSEIVRLYAVPEERVVVTPLAVDPGFLRSARDHADRVDKMPPQDPLVLHVGSIFNRRNVPTFIEAVEILNRQSAVNGQWSNVNCLIIGQDHTLPSQKIDETIRETNRRIGEESIKRVKDLSEQELRQYIETADILISLSEYEGFNLPPLEAQALGTPVIMLDTPIAREVFAGSVVYVASTEDTTNIATAIRQVLRGDNTALIERGYANVRQYSWQRCAEQTLGTLFSALIRVRSA